jgi:hypothetical protein
MPTRVTCSRPCRDAVACCASRRNPRLPATGGDELRERDIFVSCDTLWRFLKRESFSFKKAVFATEQDRHDVARRRACQGSAIHGMSIDTRGRMLAGACRVGAWPRIEVGGCTSPQSQTRSPVQPVIDSWARVVDLSSVWRMLGRSRRATVSSRAGILFGVDPMPLPVPPRIARSSSGRPCLARHGYQPMSSDFRKAVPDLHTLFGSIAGHEQCSALPSP